LSTAGDHGREIALVAATSPNSNVDDKPSVQSSKKKHAPFDKQAADGLCRRISKGEVGRPAGSTAAFYIAQRDFGDAVFPCSGLIDLPR